MTEKDGGVLRWRDSLLMYADRRVLGILVLGFFSGLPLLLVYGTLQARLTNAGASLTTIGLFSWASIAYAFKWAWSPLVDRLPLPLLTRWLGQRRGWLLLSQIAVVITIAGLGLADPAHSLITAALWAVALAFASATQDIVIDAYRVESLPPEERAAGSGAIVLGYRIGMIAAGAGALIIADHAGWIAAYGTMAAAMAVGPLFTLALREPARPGADAADTLARQSPALWLQEAVVAPLADFMTRRGWIALLVFIALYKAGDGLVSAISTPFYLKTGFTKTEIAEITKVWGVVATIGGGLLGGVITARLGLYRSLLLCGVLQGVSALMFVLLAEIGANLPLLALGISLENFTGGMGTAAFVAFLSGLCSASFTATQYALVSSFMAFARSSFGSGGGWLADRVSWPTYFLIATAAAVPGLLLLAVLQRRQLIEPGT